MEDQSRFGFRLNAPGWNAVMGILGAVGIVACAGPAWHAGSAVKPDERIAAEYCVMDREGEPGGRVVNYVDPELCGRWVRERSAYYVRVPEPPDTTKRRGR